VALTLQVRGSNPVIGVSENNCEIVLNRLVEKQGLPIKRN